MENNIKLHLRMFLGIIEYIHTSNITPPSSRNQPTTIPLVVEGGRKAILIISTP
jgi:hypothetical protein